MLYLEVVFLNGAVGISMIKFAYQFLNIKVLWNVKQKINT